MNREHLVAELEEIVGAEYVLADEESRERYSFDALSPGRLFGREEAVECRVDAVARPGSTAEVARVVQLAGALGAAVVPYGGGSGVMGSVIPLRGGIALDLRRMDRVLEIQRGGRIARVQPGLLLSDLDGVARTAGLMLGHDPWSVAVATVGGALSTDSVGYRASRYGSMGKQVRALEAVLGDGSIVRSKALAQPTTGPAMVPLFVGAEGTMGVVTEATIQLFPIPEARRFATFGFESFESGYAALLRLFDIGLVPALVDLTEEEPTPLTQGYRCLLYLAFEGYAEEVEAAHRRALIEGLSRGVNLGPRPTERYWKGRHEAAERWRAQMQPLRPADRWAVNPWRAADYLHLALPASAVLDYHRWAHRVVAEHGLLVREAAAWTSPELYSLFVTDPHAAQGPRPGLLAQAVDRLLHGALEVGGGVEYCHGAGLKLDPYMPEEWGEALLLARRLKGAVDPAHILNAGKLGLR